MSSLPCVGDLLAPLPLLLYRPLGRAVPAVQQGMTEEMVASLVDVDTADITEREKLAVRFAERMATDHHSMDDNFFDELRAGSQTPGPSAGSGQALHPHLAAYSGLASSTVRKTWVWALPSLSLTKRK